MAEVASCSPVRPLRALVIEDERGLRANLVELLENEGFRVIAADDGRAGVELARSHDLSIVLCDVRMPDMDGFEVLRRLRAEPGTRAVPFLFLTAACDRESVRTGMRLGADDYITKPFTRVEVLAAIRARLGRTESMGEAAPLKKASPDVVVRDPAMIKVHEEAARAARSLLSVLVLGETGVGKEVLARRIHEESPRAARPFVAINCAALSQHLIEAELFGHERGAYTGASSTQQGLIESANGGTVFLDEVGELPLSVQVKLLRVLEDRRVYRVGGRASLPVDVRFVSATNRDLDRAIDEGAFRLDLLYRLNGFVLSIPALRERRRELIPLAVELIRASAAQMGLAEAPVLTFEAAAALARYNWPGNVRELRNAMERAVAVCNDSRIGVESLPARIAHATADPSDDRAPDTLPSAPVSGLRAEVEALERKRIVEALDRCSGNQTAAAEMLGISRRTLVTRLSTFSLPRPRKRVVGLSA